MFNTTAAPDPKTKEIPEINAAAPGVFTDPKPISTNPYTTTTPTFPGIENVLASDPMYQQLISFDKGASADDLATMNRNISQIQSYYGSDSDPLSLFGRIFQGYQDRKRTIANTLTGHGMINSGETPFQGARATLAYQQQEYDAKFKLQQYIQGLNDSFKAAERARKTGEMQAGWTSVQNWTTNNPPVTAPDPNYVAPPNSDYYPIEVPGVGTVGYAPDADEIARLVAEMDAQARQY